MRSVRSSHRAARPAGGPAGPPAGAWEGAVAPKVVAVPESPSATRLKPSLGVSGARPISIVSTQLKTQLIRFGCLGRPENLPYYENFPYYAGISREKRRARVPL